MLGGGGGGGVLGEGWDYQHKTLDRQEKRRFPWSTENEMRVGKDDETRAQGSSSKKHGPKRHGGGSRPSRHLLGWGQAGGVSSVGQKTGQSKWKGKEEEAVSAQLEISSNQRRRPWVRKRRVLFDNSWALVFKPRKKKMGSTPTQ